MRTNSPQDAEIFIQKLPSDMGIHRNPRKGTLNAPEEILDDFSTDKDILIGEVFPDEFSLETTHRRISKNTEDLIKHGSPLISIGGDHSISFPVLKVLKKEISDLKLIWLDSHLDLKQKVDGNVSHDVVARELLEHGFSTDDIFFVGTTKVDEDEKMFLEENNIRFFEADELDKFKREFEKNEKPVYLSIDIDVLREDQAPGTGYPDGDVDIDEVLELIEAVKPEYADIVEVAPPFDQEEITLENSRKILSKLLDEIKSR